MPGRAVVLFQPDHGSARKVLFEAQDVAHFRTAPAIDRLVVVAHAADVAMPPRQQAQPQVLRDVGVLILVYQDIPEPAPVLRQHVLVRLEDRDHVQQQIAEIAGVQIAQAALVGGIQRHALAVERTRIGHRHLVRGQRAVLPAVDDPRQHPRGPAFVVDVVGTQHLLHQPDLVVGIQDGEVRLQPGQFRVAPQQLDADRMKGAEPGHPLHRLAQQPPDAQLHLARGLVGERDGEDLVWARGAGGQQVRDPGGQGTRLAGARTGQHQDRPLQRLDRRALRRVQPVQIGCRPCGHRLARQRNRGRLECVFVGITAHGRQPSPTSPAGKDLFLVRSFLAPSSRQ